MIDTRASLAAGTLAGVPGPRPRIGWPIRSCGTAVAGAGACANAVLPKAAAAAAPAVPARNMRRFIPLLPRDRRRPASMSSRVKL